MRLISWNVNSLGARLTHVLRLLEAEKPDILLLQELKGEADNLPLAALHMAGYACTLVGQKSHAGVAVLSRQPAQIRLKQLASDVQARYLEVACGDLLIVNIYAPNGNPLGSDKYAYKLRWFDWLAARLDILWATRQPVVVGGDFNIIPEPVDARRPAAWVDDALYQPTVRDWWRAITHQGWVDALRTTHPTDTQLYSFWDYRGNAFAADDGIRIDHFLLSPEAADRLQTTDVLRGPRGWDQPSDHTPVSLTLRAGGHG